MKELYLVFVTQVFIIRIPLVSAFCDTKCYFMVNFNAFESGNAMLIHGTISFYCLFCFHYVQIDFVQN